jgi:hypothetical protein
MAHTTTTTVEVFATNVQGQVEAAYLICLLKNAFPDYRVNFDLHDCDNVLRVEGKNVDPAAIVRILKKENFSCEVLT